MKKIVLVLMTMTVGACTTSDQQFSSVSSASLKQFNQPVTQEDLLSGEIILGSPLSEEDLPDDNILALTGEMEHFLNKYVLSKVAEPYRARQLNRVLFDEEIFGMKYDLTKTFTARGAFENKLGNCLAFSYLYSSFADKADILFEYQEVDVPLNWSPETGKIDKVWRHINLRVKNGADAGSVFDINEINANQKLNSRTLTLPHALALYYSNIGAENLLNGNESEAFLYFAKGISLTSEEPDLWVNLGVLFKQKGLYNYAKLAYENALVLDQENFTANANMANLYLTLGNGKKADFYKKAAENTQIKNPNYQYRMAQAEFNKKHYRKALTHLDVAFDYGMDEKNYVRLKNKIQQRKKEKFQWKEDAKFPFQQWDRRIVVQ
ncbi:MAG: hypothetical protein HOM01_11565 [Kordiimonadaceae bacterium]|jgi:hypothetical protein|nr:hypothetical protein [Kordiimonadaceae bacterium]